MKAAFVMIQFKAVILKFDQHGEKTGWTYIEIPAAEAEKLIPGNKKSFRVKGMLDRCAIKQTALLPMGDGDFILPLNATMRKQLGKSRGEQIEVRLEPDESPVQISDALMSCLSDEPDAMQYFSELPGSHRQYFSKWIESAKTDETKARRIAMSVNALLKRQGFAEMLRAAKNDRNKLLS